MEELHAIYLRLANEESPPARKELAEALLLHPLSTEKLKSACGAVLRSRSCRRDLCDDVMQGARLKVAGNLMRGRVFYEDRGTEKFGGWLWSIWFTACRIALRRTLPRTSTELRDVPAKDKRNSAEQLSDLMAIASDMELKPVLQDWLAGYTVRESADRMRTSKSEVGRMRQRLLDAAKRRISVEH